jgi:thiamine transport system permease protein
MSIAFALVPILAIFRKSLISNSSLSTNAWREVLSNTRVLNSLITSLGYAVVTILIATTIALLAASSLAYNKNFRFISALTSLPILVSAVSIGLGIIVTFDTQPFNWRGSQMMLPIAHALVALPLAIRAITPVLNDIPDSLRQASSVLGANNWQVWRTIDFKIVRRAIIVAAAISAAVSLGEFGASSFLVRRNSETLPVTISRLLSRPGDILQSQGYALASLLIIFSIIVIFVIDKFSTTESANSRA